MAEERLRIARPAALLSGNLEDALRAAEVEATDIEPGYADFSWQGVFATAD